ncbi:MAG: threonine-phosphate decarboxylase CobD [Candidatus Polarisedimenticolaceae bacterium]|nr:threonine-phosphate decarboxylase CobD [Candidatus Polarisedimenticolaceae bacterium]
MLEHGGRVRAAASHYAVPYAEWLDLSTGINPNGWPVPAIPGHVWQQLPEEEDELVAVAQNYYQAPALLPVAGSQAAIQMIPELRPACQVGIISPGYAEHAAAWSRAGHTLQPLHFGQIKQQINRLDVLLLIHPNNPTGECFSREQLLIWRQKLANRGGWLIVDEAFIDSSPKESLAPESSLPGLIVLRSLGKFFGLAGARVGFVLAEESLLKVLSERLGPWSISSPARWVASQALQDYHWQQQARQQLNQQASQLNQLLQDVGLKPTGGSALFQWVITPAAKEIHHQLAKQGILTRLFQEPCSLRFGLPADRAAFDRLQGALQQIQQEVCLP